MAVDLQMDPRVFLDEDPAVQDIVERMIVIRVEQVKEQKEQQARNEMRSGL